MGGATGEGRAVEVWGPPHQLLPLARPSAAAPCAPVGWVGWRRALGLSQAPTLGPRLRWCFPPSVGWLAVGCGLAVVADCGDG